MKTLKLIFTQLLLAVSLFVSTGTNVAPMRTVVLHKQLKPTLVHRAPERQTMFCYYYSDCLYIYSEVEVSATITVENISCGDISYETAVLSLDPIMISVTGSGLYSIEIDLSNGVQYTGEFEIYD